VGKSLNAQGIILLTGLAETRGTEKQKSKVFPEFPLF